MSILGICQTPEILQVMIYVKYVIIGIRVLVPIIIIIKSCIDLMNSVTNENSDVMKNLKQIFVIRFIACIIIFFVPNLINVVLDVSGNRYGYEECVDLATKERVSNLYISRAEKLVATAEKNQTRGDLSQARVALNNVDNETTKKNLSNRLDIVEESIKKKEEEEKKDEEYGSSAPGGSIETGSGTSSNGKGTCRTGTVYSSEPNPADPMSCWPNIISMSKFTFPLDSNGKKLGAFPKNYSSIPTQLTNYKIYHGEFIIPVTPVNSKYNFVYKHNGIDFMAVFGTPIYSPVDGTLKYSEWGHTGNKGWDETAYSVSIVMDKPVTIKGKKIGQIFLTHLSGIRYRCSSCNFKVKKGQLLGFVGNAAGKATEKGWAPHLHMTMYPVGKYDQGLYTNDIEDLYNLSSGMTLTAGG